MAKLLIFTVSNDIIYDQRMQRICETLVEAGYDVTLVGRNLKRKPDKDFVFRTKRLSCFFNSGKLFYAELNIRLFLYLVFQKFDALCAVDLDTAMPVWAAAKLKNKPFGLDAHEYFQEVPEVVNRKHIQKIWERVGRFVIPKTNFRYTVSPGLAREFKDLYNVEFEVVRNLPKFKPHQAEFPSQPFLLYQGALNKGRGLEALIRAAQHIPIPVKIAGEGDLSQELRALSGSLNLENKVTFLGYLKPEELQELTPNAFLGYNLLENTGLSYYYSLANKFFDYTMAGVPCLNSPFPEYKYLNEKYDIGILTELTENQIVKAVTDLYSNREHYLVISENCLVAAKELNWEKEKQILLEIYKRIIPTP